MLKIFSRINRINKAPVNKPNSSFGFLCLMALKSLCTREKAGATFSHKDKPLKHPPYQYWINKQFVIIILISLLSSCQPVPAFAQNLIASFYSLTSLKKEGTFKRTKGRMANNEYFDENALTCASCDFPLKTKLRVTTIKAPKKSIIVEVTDRTAQRFKGKRVDLSKRAFAQISSLEQGLCEVSVERVK